MNRYDAAHLKVLECNLDDMNPEYYPHLLDQLFSAGARDAWITPIIMKGGRPGACLSVLCEEQVEEALLSVLFQQSTTLGIRSREVKRYQLERKTQDVDTSLGKVTLKIGSDRSGTECNVAPEYSSCRKLAEKHGIPLKRVYEEAITAWRKEK